MDTHEEMTYTVRDKGGPKGGKTLTAQVPKFDLQVFVNLPNFEVWANKKYDDDAKRIVREIEQGTNGTVQSDLESMSSVIMRSLYFTKEQIETWVEQRDWTKAISKASPEQLKKVFLQFASDFANRQIPMKLRADAERIAKDVDAAVADYPNDPVADYIFSILTSPPREPKITMASL
jgi:hypothetical protein